MTSLESFIEPTPDEYLSVINRSSSTIGGGLSDIVYFTPRGGGIFSFLKRIVFPLIKQPALKFGQNVLSDISQGKNIKHSLKNNGISAVSDIASSALGQSKGGARTKKRKKPSFKKCQSKRKRYKYEIFRDGSS